MNTVSALNIDYPGKDTVTLYQYIYKNAQYGMGALGKILEHQDHSELTEILKGQQRGYTAILREAANVLAISGIRPIGLKNSEKLEICFLLRCLSLKKNATSLPSIAGMVILGTTIGGIKGAKESNLCPGADPASKALLERLLRFEEANCRRLKSFL